MLPESLLETHAEMTERYTGIWLNQNETIDWSEETVCQTTSTVKQLH